MANGKTSHDVITSSADGYRRLNVVCKLNEDLDNKRIGWQYNHNSDVNKTAQYDYV